MPVPSGTPHAEPLNVQELEEAAHRRLPRLAYDYFASGADDEVALQRNRKALRRLLLRYRTLVDVSKRDLSTTVLGLPIRMPLLIGPTAFHALAHPDAELGMVRGAGAAGTIFTLSTLSNTAVEDVTAAATGPVFFQLYVYKDRGTTRDLVERARAAGCRALVLTVDAPFMGRRERDIRNRFHLPPAMTVKNLTAAGMGEMPAPPSGSGLNAYVAELLDASFSWKDMEWLASLTDLPLVVKGLVRGDDAVRAVEHGAAGVVVSNHGGRQLDAAPASIDVLPEVVEAVDGRAEVLVDGGFRRGTDVVKALALGARAVLIGRPSIWGLAIGGTAGVKGVLDMLYAEIDLAMALCGCPTLADITPDLIGRPPR